MKQIINELFTALLKKADKSPGKPVRMGKTEQPMKAYLNNDPVGIRETFHQEFKRLEAAGILSIKWHNPNILIQYILLLDADLLAEQVGYSRISNRFEKAKAQVRSELTDSPHLKAIESQLFSKWQSTGKFEGFTVDEPQDLIDAVKAADAMLNLLDTDMGESDERHFSTRVFSDSKKLKSLMGKIAKVIRLRDNEIPDELEHHEVFQLFGVVPMKHPIYVAGAITLIADNEKSASADFPPCMGIWPDHITAVKQNSPISIITSIENFATYMRYVGSEKQDHEVVLYTAGIPSPSFRAFYTLLTSTFPEVALRHWGDIDVGGFTILNILEKTAERAVTAFRMTPDHYVGCKDFGRLTSSESKRLTGLAERLSEKNRDVVLEVIEFEMKYEQESFRESNNDDA